MDRTKYEYIGNLSQLFHVENYRMEGGKKDGVRVTNVQNENGLNYTVVADRCMDIANLSFKGINISYINPSGIVAPEYYDRTGVNWLKSFTAGFVTTCGLDNVGNPCEDGEELGLHGRIGNTPADEYNVRIIREFKDVFVANDEYKELRGKTISLKDLKRFPILMLDRKSTTCEFLHQVFQKSQLDLVPEIELSSNDLLIDLARIVL